MKLIKQSFEILEQKDFTIKGIKQFVERCARVSYKSEDKMTDTSYEKFVGMLESRDHARPLEFGTVHIKMSDAQFECLQTLLMDKVYNDYWIKYNIIDTEDEDNCYITTNYRYYLELCKYDKGISEYLDPSDNPLYPRRYTVHMILDRGVMDEFRTHVGLSHLAESTRYCNYSKDKFNNEVTFVIPSWCNSLVEGSKQEYSPFEINGDEVEFMNALQNAQNSYLSLLKMGWTPQQARSVLPLGIKSELISCGFEDAWKNFFYRRDAKDAHPMAQEIAKPMHKEFIERGFIDK
jgi:thymidylate synthase (FAD)